MRGFATTGLFVLAVACASGGNRSTAGPSRCAPIVSDSLLERTPVYPACGVTREARMTSAMLRPQYTPPAGVRCARASVQVVVDADGRPVMSTAKIVRATDQALGTAILLSLSGAKYDPALKDGARVPQIVTVEWGLSAYTVPANTSPSAARASRASAPRC